MREYTYSSDKEFSTRIDWYELDIWPRHFVQGHCICKKKINSNQTVLHTRAPKFK